MYPASLAIHNKQLQALQQQPPSLTSVAGFLFATFFPVASFVTMGHCCMISQLPRLSQHSRVSLTRQDESSRHYFFACATLTHINPWKPTNSFLIFSFSLMHLAPNSTHHDQACPRSYAPRDSGRDMLASLQPLH